MNGGGAAVAVSPVKSVITIIMTQCIIHKLNIHRSLVFIEVKIYK